MGLVDYIRVPLELSEVLLQIKQMPEIQCSTEDRRKISQEVNELLSKGVIQQAGNSKRALYPGGEKGGRAKTSNKPEVSQCHWKDFKMEVLHLLLELFQANKWIIKMDLKDAYLQVKHTSTSSSFNGMAKHINSSTFPSV